MRDGIHRELAQGRDVTKAQCKVSTRPALSKDGAMKSKHHDRQYLLKLIAHASCDELRAAIAAIKPPPLVSVVRPPETGLVMIQGRMGGDGAPFNVGEAAVTRAVVRLSTGEMGFSYLLGRRGAEAEAAATIDALGQRPADRATLETAFVAPLSARLAAEAGERNAETDATRVAFFTLERGESPT